MQLLGHDNGRNTTISNGTAGQILTIDNTGNPAWITPTSVDVRTVLRWKLSDGSFNYEDFTNYSQAQGYIKCLRDLLVEHGNKVVDVELVDVDADSKDSYAAMFAGAARVSFTFRKS